MTLVLRRPSSPFLAAILAATVVVACSSATPSPSPSELATPVVTPTAAPTPTIAPTVAPTATPIASPAASAPASPAGSTAACAPLPPAITLPSDRLTDVKVVPGDTTDNVQFVFGTASLPGPAGTPMGKLTIAKRPYTQAGSGAPIAIKGDHVLQLTMTGMSVQNDAGQPTYDGPTDIKQALPAFQQAVQYDASEGVVGWYIGYDGDGCVSLISNADGLLLSIAQR
jgi:hypothetical protein